MALGGRTRRCNTPLPTLPPQGGKEQSERLRRFGPETRILEDSLPRSGEGRKKNGGPEAADLREACRMKDYSAFMIASALDTSKAPGASTFSALTTPFSTTMA